MTDKLTVVDDYTTGTEHHVPGGKPHNINSRECWCEPTIEIVDYVADIAVVVHRGPPDSDDESMQ